MAVCLGCHKGLCEECRQFYNGKSVCVDCLNIINEKESSNSADDLISSLGYEIEQVHDKLKNIIKEEKIDTEMNKLKIEASDLVDDIHSRFLNFKSTRSNDHGYLICEECSGYYKLEKGESLEDFESCECGGKLKFKKTLKLIKN